MKKNKLCVALDVNTFEKAQKLIDDLAGSVGLFKVGKQLFTTVGPKIVEYIKSKNLGVFLDLKYHDIPNTVRGASQAAASMGVDLFTIHASGGFEMMRAAVQGVQDAGENSTKILAVTVLTSINQDILKQDLHVPDSMEDHVKHLALMANEACVHGVVASPNEIKLIRKACGKDLLIVTPGIRPSWTAADDQKRTMNPKEAIQAGANYIVIGRPITKAGDPKLAAEKIAQEM